MNSSKIKKVIESILQFGWMWGYPKYVEDWDLIHRYYREELNNGKDFKPDVTKKAKGTRR